MSDDRDAGPRWSWLAVGGALLAGFALVLAAGTLVLSLVAPSPLLLVFPFLFGPLALAGAIMGGLGRRVARRAPEQVRGARAGAAGVALGLLAVGVVLPAAVAQGLPRFRAYQLDSREKQALHFLSQIRMGAISWRHEGGHGRFPVGDSGWAPPRPPTSERYPYEAQLWTREPWASLDFAPSTAHFHQYRYRGAEDGQSFVIAARGDLDGDGRYATYTATVTTRADGRVERLGPTRTPQDAR